MLDLVKCFFCIYGNVGYTHPPPRLPRTPCSIGAFTAIDASSDMN